MADFEQTMSRRSDKIAAGKDYTIAFLGCGNLSTGILVGITKSLHKIRQSGSKPSIALPDRIIACVRSDASVARLKKTFEAHPETAESVSAGSLEIFQKRNVDAVNAADVVVLGCKPFTFRDLLKEPSLASSLNGKVLVSILAGVTRQMLLESISEPMNASCENRRGYQISVVRAMPSVAATVQQSMTALEAPFLVDSIKEASTAAGWSEDPVVLPEPLSKVIEWMFEQVGSVSKLPSTTLDAVTALCGSGPAFAALALEGLADGAVAMGVPRVDAIRMAAQTLKGTAELVLAGGEHPSILREKVSTPGGCTIAGSLVLEEAGVRGTIARAVREATTVASKLGSGAKNVNGTRH